MVLLKIALAVLVAFCLLVVLTISYVHFAVRNKVAAIGLGALLAMILNSPLYWVLALAMLACICWLSRRWLF